MGKYCTFCDVDIIKDADFPEKNIGLCRECKVDYVIPRRIIKAAEKLRSKNPIKFDEETERAKRILAQMVKESGCMNELSAPDVFVYVPNSLFNK